MTRTFHTLSRRRLLSAGAAAALPLHALAEESGPAPTPAQVAAQLPLKTTGIEHVSMQVPDVEAAGAFFGRVFNPGRLIQGL